MPLQISMKSTNVDAFSSPRMIAWSHFHQPKMPCYIMFFVPSTKAFVCGDRQLLYRFYQTLQTGVGQNLKMNIFPSEEICLQLQRLSVSWPPVLVQIVAPIVALAKKQFYLAQNYANAMENVTQKMKIISTKNSSIDKFSNNNYKKKFISLFCHLVVMQSDLNPLKSKTATNELRKLITCQNPSTKW